MKFVKFTFVVIAIALFAFACTQAKKPSVNSTENVNKTVESSPEVKPTEKLDELALGGKIYAEYCVKCHKEDGTGGKVEIDGETIKAENFTSKHAMKESDEEFIEHIKDGIEDEGMPSFKDKLSDDEIKTVVNYIRKEIQK